MSNFRIIAHMHHFYNDYRSSSRLFITSKIKTIEDLKEHISNLFDLRVDFYLISNNLYLPNSEDIRVLREDDIVVVIPCKEIPLTNAVGSSKSEVILDLQNASGYKAPKRCRTIFNDCGIDLQESGAKKKKKGKKSEAEIVNGIDMEIENQICKIIFNEPQSEITDFQESGAKKKKKRKKSEAEIVNGIDMEIENQSSLNIQKKEKNKKQKNYLLNELRINPNLTEEKSKIANNKGYEHSFNAVEVGNDLLKKENKINEKSDLDQSTVIGNTSSKPFIVPRKNIKLMEISTKPKIIKSICVKDAPVDINYVNVESVSSNSIYKQNGVTDGQISVDKNITARIGIKHEIDKKNQETCHVKNELNESKFVNVPSTEIYKNQSYSKNFLNRYLLHEMETCKVVQPLTMPENKVVPLNHGSHGKNSSATVGKEEINLNEKIKIISVESFTNKQNQSKSEQLLKNETIGPQLIPFPQSTATQIVVLNSTENPTSEPILQSNVNPTPEPTLHLISPNIIQPNSLNGDEEGQCFAGFKNPVVATPSESIISSLTEESGVDLAQSFETKPKRKRVRKRKPKTKKEENGFEPPVVVPRPVFTSAAPVMHIRFENEAKEGQHESVACEDTTDVIDINLNYDKLCKEEVLKYPVMQDKLPKQGDVIAFKICRLSECYTPEISDVIIAKVLNYCSDTNNVGVTVLEGADQCYTPEGKFYMEPCDNNEEEEEKIFLWSDLIEPRLLFP